MSAVKCCERISPPHHLPRKANERDGICKHLQYFAITKCQAQHINHRDSNLSHNSKKALSVRAGCRDFSAAASLVLVFGTGKNNNSYDSPMIPMPWQCPMCPVQTSKEYHKESFLTQERLVVDC